MKKSTQRAQATFTSIESVNRPRSSFNLSKKILSTFFAGDLVPMGLFEVLPGDTVKIQSANFVRMSTPVFPLMDDLFIDVHWWYCPNRIVWTNFAKMMGEQTNPTDSIDYVVPQVTWFGAAPIASGDLGDYFGIPTGVMEDSSVSALPFRMYNKIWSEWYRAQDLQPSAFITADDMPIPLGAGGAPYSVLRRGKRKGYLSAALPFAQKGDPVEIDLGGQAPLVWPSGIGLTTTGAPSFEINNQIGHHLVGAVTSNAEWDSPSIGEASWDNPELQIPTDGYADLSSASPLNVNQLREAFAFQQLLERDARGGTRQQEQNLAHFGVMSNDQRLNRPEYLGGSSQVVNIHSVPQTNFHSPEQAPERPLGTLGAYGTSGTEGRTIVRSLTEHGYIMCLVSTRSELTYQQGLERHWSREGKFDFYWPDLAGLGEQPILGKEIYFTGLNTDSEDNSVWGYIGRWDEYRTSMNSVTGAFRSNYMGTLDPWHLALTFSNRPVLDDVFIQEDPPMARVLATGDSEPHFIGDFRHNITITRVMPMHGTPGLTRL